MTDVLQPDRVLDCSGLLCPLPVIRTSKAIKEIAIGQVLKVIATDPGAPADMEAWARQTGNELIDAHEENGKCVFFFRRVR
jgi:tRNA 2-thiouridine synthesizing protein A